MIVYLVQGSGWHWDPNPKFFGFIFSKPEIGIGIFLPTPGPTVRHGTGAKYSWPDENIR